MNLLQPNRVRRQATGGKHPPPVFFNMLQIVSAMGAQVERVIGRQTHAANAGRTQAATLRGIGHCGTISLVRQPVNIVLMGFKIGTHRLDELDHILWDGRVPPISMPVIG